MKTDSQGRSYYGLDEVKEMAAAKGLPCEIKFLRNHSRRKQKSEWKGMKIVTPQSTLEALGLTREWSRYYVHQYPKAKSVSATRTISHVDPYEYASRLAALNID